MLFIHVILARDLDNVNNSAPSVEGILLSYL